MNELLQKDEAFFRLQTALDKANQKTAKLQRDRDALLKAAKTAVRNFERAAASGNFLGDDEHESWSLLDAAIQQAESED